MTAEAFARKALRRGASGRHVVHELIRLGYCDADQARDLVSREGPPAYARKRGYYFVVSAVGALLFLVPLEVMVLAPPNIHSGSFLGSFVIAAVSIIAGPIVMAFGWAGRHRFRRWNPDLDEPDPQGARLEGFARESLRQGRGEWWIVNEMVRRSSISETEAREVVSRVAPALLVEFIRRRRAFLRIGLSIMVVCLIGLVGYSGVRHVIVYSLAGLVLGGFLTAHGWPGWRRLRAGDAPTGLPGSGEAGPVSTGLTMGSGTFDVKP